jgi:hypothetical protein
MSAWLPTPAGWLVSTFISRPCSSSSSSMSGQQPPPQPPNRMGWGRMPPSPSPVPFRAPSPYAPSPPPMSARRLPGSPMSPMSPMFGCPSPSRLPPRMAAPGTPYIPCPRPRWAAPLPPGVPLPPGPRPYRLTPVQVRDTQLHVFCCSSVWTESDVVLTSVRTPVYNLISDIDMKTGMKIARQLCKSKSKAIP